MRGFCQRGCLKEVVGILDIKDTTVEFATHASLLQVWIHRKELLQGKRIHVQRTQMGVAIDKLVENTLIKMYVKCASLADARKVFDKMSERDVCSWTLMIAAYAKQGPAEEALILFREMQDVEADQLVFSSVVSACAKLAFIEQGMELHRVILTRAFQSHVSVANALIDMYAKCGNVQKAQKLFNEMPEPDVISWTSLIAGYTHSGLVHEALGFFERMPHRDIVSWNAMVVGFSQNGFVDEAMKLFNEMPQSNVVSWNAMITGFAQRGLVDKALKLFQEMPQRDVVSWNAMLAGFAQNGFVDEALKLFQEMPRPNLVSWNAMIAGFGQNGHIEETLVVFREMELAGMMPNSKTFACILPACAKFGALEQGKEIHEKIIRGGFHSDVYVTTALVDMYARCGNIEKARELFNRMHPRPIVSWNAMIGGYAMNGDGKEVFQLFEEMKYSGMVPNHITLVCVLSACSHAGMVDEGYQHFNCMRKHYNIVPGTEHYVCMVDLLGRAGRLDEAKDFITKMPFRPAAIVWICLLGACRMHNNVELGEYVADQIFKLEPENTAPYVLLSNIYAAAGRWSDIEKVRKKMRGRDMKKKPGCSWIELNKHVHAFLGGSDQI
ncbi:pentatricopeptide repeat-containing protein At4g02750 [Cryptomeria japonica]|uniref:pentatricopeptide repeat-containing protein At4g02750 n=1 Tax=Cryptomeria japonica TaxID=3369 RepID=UPI0027DA4B84|nr:pentatricopeptide repeat-containing protein At4g02750 [Cryptomeria japonica]